MIKFAKSMKGRNEYSRSPLVHFYEYALGKELPKVFLDLKRPNP
jgi:hypothetical protein